MSRYQSGVPAQKGSIMSRINTQAQLHSAILTGASRNRVRNGSASKPVFLGLIITLPF
jgi:hypothetical protein